MKFSKFKKPLCAAIAVMSVAASLSVAGGVSASASTTGYNAWCDVNSDGYVDTDDVITLLDYVDSEVGAYFAKTACYDYNHDGVVDTKDAIKLANYTLFPGKYQIGNNIADFNDDGKITTTDVSYMYSNFDKLKNNICYDFDGNGKVEDADIDYLLYYIIFPNNYPLNVAISSNLWAYEELMYLAPDMPKLNVIYDRVGNVVSNLYYFYIIAQNRCASYIPGDVNLKYYSNPFITFSNGTFSVLGLDDCTFTEKELDIDGDNIVTKMDISVIADYWMCLAEIEGY